MTTLARDRLAAADVRATANELRDFLVPYAERVEFAGSLRRGSPTVKDVELVLVNPTPDFYAITDALIAKGAATKALYGETQSTRWGEKYRGLVYQGVRFELFTADSDNAGYITWLRTGPGDANKYLVTAIKFEGAPFSLKDGYVWKGDRKLRVGSERAWFSLLGMPLLEAGLRSAATYRDVLTSNNHRWGEPDDFLPPPERADQQALFDDDGGDIPTGRVERGGKSDAEKRYIAEHYSRRYGQTPEFWLRPDAPNPYEYARARRGEG